MLSLSPKGQYPPEKVPLSHRIKKGKQGRAGGSPPGAQPPRPNTSLHVMPKDGSLESPLTDARLVNFPGEPVLPSITWNLHDSVRAPKLSLEAPFDHQGRITPGP